MSRAKFSPDRQGTFVHRMPTPPLIRRAPRPLRVLVGCEHTGAVRDAFAALGHHAVSCDLLPSEVPGPHIQGDLLEVIAASDGQFDLLIAHPPCTYLANSGIHWNKRVPGREEKTQQALEFVRALMDAPIPKIAIENPAGRISTAIRKPDQYIQPYQFGSNASKTTGLWLKNLPKLVGTSHVPGRRVLHGGKFVERWDNQTDSGQNKLPPSKDRWKLRSATYPGIAQSMAEQWGGLVDSSQIG